MGSMRKAMADKSGGGTATTQPIGDEQILRVLSNLGFGGRGLPQVGGGLARGAGYAPPPQPEGGQFFNQALALSGVKPPSIAPPPTNPTPSNPNDALLERWSVPGTWMGQNVTMDPSLNIYAGGGLLGNLNTPGVLGEGGAIRFKQPQGGYEHIKTDYHGRPLTYVGGEFIPGRGKYAGPAYTPSFGEPEPQPAWMGGGSPYSGLTNLGLGGVPYNFGAIPY